MRSNGTHAQTAAATADPRGASSSDEVASIVRGVAAVAATVESVAAVGAVLACLDRSSTGESALAHAAALAKLFEAPLTLLHVVDPLSRASESAPTDPFAWELRL